MDEPTTGSRRPTGIRSSWLYLAIVGLVAAVLFVVLLRPAGPGPGPTLPQLTAAPEPIPTAAAGLAIGMAATLPGGAVARLNAVERGVTLAPGLPGPEPGKRLDRLDVEICAGSEPSFVDAAFWNGTGDDRRVHSAHMGVRSLVTLTMSPGSCQRGTVDLAVPEGVELQTVLLMDTSQTMVARWTVGGEPGGGEPGGLQPLTSGVEPDSATLGTPVLTADGPNAAAYAIEPGAVTSVDAEVCAGPASIPVSPRHWFLELPDHRLIVADAEASSFRSGTVEVGTCERGAVTFRLPAGSQPIGVRYAFGGQYETARWTLASP